MSALEAAAVFVLGLFALVGLGLYDRRLDRKNERFAWEAEKAREAAQVEHDAAMLEVDAKAAKVAAAETGAEAFNAAFDD